MKEIEFKNKGSELYGTIAVYLWVIIPIGTFLTIAAAGLAVRMVW